MEMNQSEDVLEQMKSDWERLSLLVDDALASPDSVRVTLPLPPRRSAFVWRGVLPPLLRILAGAMMLGVLAAMYRSRVHDVGDLVCHILVGAMIVGYMAGAAVMLADRTGRISGPLHSSDFRKVLAFTIVAGMLVVGVADSPEGISTFVCGTDGPDVVVAEIDLLFNLIPPQLLS